MIRLTSKTEGVHGRDWTPDKSSSPRGLPTRAVKVGSAFVQASLPRGVSVPASARLGVLGVLGAEELGTDDAALGVA